MLNVCTAAMLLCVTHRTLIKLKLAKVIHIQSFIYMSDYPKHLIFSSSATCSYGPDQLKV